MKGLYDLSTLDTDFELSVIPNFTERNKNELKALQKKLGEFTSDTEERKAVSNRIGELQFLRAADLYRDLATDDWINGFEEEQELRAKQCYARAEKIRKGIDNY